ncbi:hypothetical protein D3C71_1399920 [compost metagenome]
MKPTDIGDMKVFSDTIEAFKRLSKEGVLDSYRKQYFAKHAIQNIEDFTPEHRKQLATEIADLVMRNRRN